MIEITIEDMYAEATQALGESVVRERLLAKEVQRLNAETDELRAHLAGRSTGGDGTDSPGVAR